MSEAPDFQHNPTPDQAEPPATAHRSGLSTITQGAGFVAVVTGFFILGATILMLETTLGVTFS